MAIAADQKTVLVPVGNGCEEMEAVIIVDVLRRAGAALHWAAPVTYNFSVGARDDAHMHIILWLLHNLIEAGFDPFRYLLLGDQLMPWELQPNAYKFTAKP